VSIISSSSDKQPLPTLSFGSCAQHNGRRTQLSSIAAYPCLLRTHR
jgi:hypothetical protein